MNKEELLQLGIKDIETFLNAKIQGISFEHTDPVIVRSVMIDTIKPFFNDTIEIKSTTTTKDQISIIINNLCLSFKVSIKIINKQIKAIDIGKFKLDNAIVSFDCPVFESDGVNNSIVKVACYTTSALKISLKKHKGKLEDILCPDALQREIESQKISTIWGNIRKAIILKAAQPKIKREIGKFLKTQEDWDNVLEEIENTNTSLIDSEIKKLLKFNR